MTKMTALTCKEKHARNYVQLSLSLIPVKLCAVLIVSFIFPLVLQAQSWKTVENISPSDRALFDERKQTPRDTTIPYIPSEPYPFKPPYTAEEMGYRASEFPHMTRWSHVRAQVFGFITSTGYSDIGIMIGRTRQNGRDGLLGYIADTPPGEISHALIGIAAYPPALENFQQLWNTRRIDQDNPTRLDIAIYSPSLRKVRKMPPPRRDDRFPANAMTFDDSVGRDPWEQQWQLVGTDVLYETARYPNTRPVVTFNPQGRGFTDVDPSSIKLMGESYENYTEKNGVECWVLKATIDPKWLPNYKEKYLLYWLEKTTFFPLRMEKYDHDGNLMMIEVRHAAKENPALGNFGYATRTSIYWDIGQDLIGMASGDSHILRDWTKEEEDNYFSAEFMLREWMVVPLKTQLLPNGPKEFFLRPNLYPDKFPNHRNTQLPPEVERRYRAQEHAGHLVFDE